MDENHPEPLELELSQVKMLEIRLNATGNVLRIREKELLDLKGPCSLFVCRLHYDHSGPHYVTTGGRKH